MKILLLGVNICETCAITNDLSKFNFNKSECTGCTYNTATYNLFEDSSGKCTNSECLIKKKNIFTINYCKVILDKFPDLPVCIAPYDKMNNEVDNNLKEIGLDIKTMNVEEYPLAPVKPNKAFYSSTEEYEEALGEHEIEEMAYSKEVEEIEEKIIAGEFKKVIYIGNNNPTIGYVKLMKRSILSPQESLQNQDKSNKEAAAKNTAKEISSLLQENLFPIDELSIFEDELILFIMLDTLHPKYFPQVGYKDIGKQELTDEEKCKIIKSISPQQRVIIYRNFLQKGLSTQFGANTRSMLLIKFSEQHFEEQTKTIVRKHTDAYNKKYDKIQEEQIKSLEKKPELELELV